MGYAMKNGDGNGCTQGYLEMMLSSIMASWASEWEKTSRNTRPGKHTKSY